MSDVILHVPYREKDEAKVFKIKWHDADKVWVYPYGEPIPEGLARWAYPGTVYETEDGRCFKKLINGGAEEVNRDGTPLTTGGSGRRSRSSALESEQDDEAGQVNGEGQSDSFHSKYIFDDDDDFEGIDYTANVPTKSSGNAGSRRTNIIFDDEDDDEIDAGSDDISENIITVENGIQLNLDHFRTVSELAQMTEAVIDATPAFGDIMVRGEVTNYKGPNNGNYYFHLKEMVYDSHYPDNPAHATTYLMDCAMWRSSAMHGLNFELKEGKQVAAFGHLNYNAKYHSLKLIISRMYDIGEGNAMQAYKLLKAQLEAEGLFLPEHKKPIPEHPVSFGIVTSAKGEIREDILHHVNERNPYMKIVLYNCNVQGTAAVESTIAGIKALDEYTYEENGVIRKLDFIVIGRGGGSHEEMFSVYSDERLVRAVFAAEIPIVAAVGHTGHEPLVNHVADKVCGTPTAVANLVPDVMTDIRNVARYRAEMKRKVISAYQLRRASLKGKQETLISRHPANKVKLLNNRLAAKKATLEKYHPLNRVKLLKSRLEAKRATLNKLSPESKLAERRVLLTQSTKSLHLAMNRVMDIKKNKYQVTLARLNALSPTAKLINGFGYIESGDKPINTIDDVSVNDEIRITIHDGVINTKVTNIEKSSISR